MNDDYHNNTTSEEMNNLFALISLMRQVSDGEIDDEEYEKLTSQIFEDETIDDLQSLTLLSTGMINILLDVLSELINIDKNVFLKNLYIKMQTRN